MPSSPIDTLPRPLAVAMHDAGAANMIAAWVAAASAPPERVIAAGPAAAIWRARFGADVALSDDADALDGMACLLSGTGWASDVEHRARVAAAQVEIHSVAVIDHWVNYAMRFERDGAVELPDCIWVGDDDAVAIARVEFPTVTVEQQPNHYLAEQAHAAGPVPEDGDVLFLLEPARSDWGKDRPGEFQALDYLMERRKAAGIPANTPIRLRPHPSDPAGKFDPWIAEHPGTALDTARAMGSALAQARWVVGMNSAGLVVALEAGRTVISALPPHAPPCVLPQSAITRLCDI
ncbi:hypothetical protein [Erythrobacter sp. JK5]|uniref:hypothetical protein n=1 Tax=Erythrobacter sp. JK5 TaxID=2829500 RepID=UPI001BA798FB|nr:hypothetical protein [Erythrobacter sp. JK5]QUL37344.1 hypothetical protein KDC96_13390 [Erythrobacter sp. JK5]